MDEKFAEKRSSPLKSARTKRDGLTSSQVRAIAALLEARSIVEAARQARVGESSIRRWLRQDEQFQTKLRRLREAALSHASLRLQQGASAAVEKMLSLIDSKERIESGRASLVRTALDFAFRSGAYSDLAERLTALEDSPELSQRADRMD